MTSSLPLPGAVPVGKAAAGAIAWRYKGELRVTATVKASIGFDFDPAFAFGFAGAASGVIGWAGIARVFAARMGIVGVLKRSGNRLRSNLESKNNPERRCRHADRLP